VEKLTAQHNGMIVKPNIAVDGLFQGICEQLKAVCLVLIWNKFLINMYSFPKVDSCEC
jgi:hypothetical protein